MNDPGFSASEATSNGAGVSRRRFLAAGGLGVVGLSLSERVASASQGAKNKSVVLLIPTGGMSHIDTFDPKPLALREIRGPQRPIATSLPSVQFAESLPQLAARAARLTIVRSLHHAATPIHETGLQILQTGNLMKTVKTGERSPSLAVELNSLRPEYRLAAIELGGPLLETGSKAYRGDASQTPAELTPPATLADWSRETGISLDFDRQPVDVRDRYGNNRFGRLFWEASCLVSSGVKFVTVYMFDTLSGQPTWDAHGTGTHSPANVFSYRDELGPRFDKAAAALLDDLTETGLIDHTLVACAGEMGRTPHINEHGGRDHWTHAWSGFLAGAGVPQGQVIGATDSQGAAITDAPLPLVCLYDLMRDTLGLPHREEGAANRFLA